MSFYAGKDNNGNNLIHITKTPKTVTELKSPVPIPDTVFHSNSKMLKCTYLGSATGVDVTYQTGQCAQVATFPLSYSPISTNGIPSTNYMFFVILRDGIYYIWSGLYFIQDYFYIAIEGAFNSTVPGKIGIMHRPQTEATTYDDVLQVFYPYSITTQRDSYSSEKITVWAYRLEEFTPDSSGGITIAPDTVQIGTDDLKNISFLNTTQINTIDKTWAGLPFQLLNSSSVPTSIGLNQKNIGTYDSNGNFYPIFGEGLSTNTVLRSETYIESTDYGSIIRVYAPPGSLCVFKDFHEIEEDPDVNLSDFRINLTVNTDFIYSGEQIYLSLTDTLESYEDDTATVVEYGMYAYIQVVGFGVDYFDLESVVIYGDGSGFAYEIPTKLACTVAVYY